MKESIEYKLISLIEEMDGCIVDCEVCGGTGMHSASTMSGAMHNMVYTNNKCEACFGEGIILNANYAPEIRRAAKELT